MLKNCVLCCIFGLNASVAFAQGNALPVHSTHGDAKPPPPAAETHDRRAALREALLAQRENTRPQGNQPSAERQLNDQERAELRQQVRQQSRPSP